jgi:hypothetical protein
MRLRGRDEKYPEFYVRCWWNGRHASFRNWCSEGRGSSNLSRRTKFKSSQGWRICWEVAGASPAVCFGARGSIVERPAEFETSSSNAQDGALLRRSMSVGLRPRFPVSVPCWSSGKGHNATNVGTWVRLLHGVPVLVACWRNWQTRRIQNPVAGMSSRFDSGVGDQELPEAQALSALSHRPIVPMLRCRT